MTSTAASNNRSPRFSLLQFGVWVTILASALGVGRLAWTEESLVLLLICQGLLAVAAAQAYVVIRRFNEHLAMALIAIFLPAGIFVSVASIYLWDYLTYSW